MQSALYIDTWHLFHTIN